MSVSQGWQTLGVKTYLEVLLDLVQGQFAWGFVE